MTAAENHPREAERLDALKSYRVMDSLAEIDFDELTQLASEICETPISLVSLVDDHRQWFKSKVGLDTEETDKTVAFCSHAILQDDVFIVEDSSKDERFFDNPLFVNAPYVRFYAGVPLKTQDGLPIGTLCAIDTVPRKLSPVQISTLKTLSKQVMGQLELRRLIRNQEVQVKDLELLNQDKDRFLSVVSHDMRAPFSGLIGMSQLLLADIEDSDYEFDKDALYEMVNAIHISAQSAYNFADNLLRWASLEGGHKHPVSEDFVLSQLIQPVFDNLSSFAKQKMVVLTFEGSMDVNCKSDLNILRCILLNLLSNSIKFSKTNSQVKVSFESSELENTIKVHDSGVGISIDKLNELRELGKSDSTLGTEGENGAGIGLSLCFQFIKKLNAQINIESTLGEGSTFLVVIPK
ncbi:GAF domain-containing sensor histidine kinase [Fibrobacterales bacterium]|nr:GAF domain-containing sensor histidine kinase [Fibrobacterales bacterium]